MEKRVTIKDISSALGVSYAIINRALNGKPGVSDELRERILAKAQELGYRPNKVARSMARATMNLGVVIPEQWQSYYSVLEEGISLELDRLMDYNVQGKFYRVKSSYSAGDFVRAIKDCIEDGVDGIILADLYPKGLDGILEELLEKKIPFVTVGLAKNIEGRALSSVCIDSELSGRMAAEMLSISTVGTDVVIFVGNKDNTEHSMKISGFNEGAKAHGLRVIGAYETQDDGEVAEELFLKIISQGRVPDGIYIATAGSEAIIDVADRLNLDVKIVSTDISETVARNLGGKNLICSLYQDPRGQGRLAVKALYEYLSEHICRADKLYVSPRLIIKSNLDSVR